jgi:DNA helicase HerA-like ATPase
LEQTTLGLVVEGSLVDGLKARLEGATTVEDLRVGKFVKIEGEQHDFFCLITDVQLGVSDQRVLQDPPGSTDDFLRAVLAGTTTFGVMKVQPMLMLPKGDALDLKRDPEPPRTVPSHFSAVYQADEEDFEQVFGKESDRFFVMGQPLDMDIDICLDLQRFVERSNGVFGKSGTGKSFLTRLLLCGVVKSGVAVNLIFDMHSEYGHGNLSSGGTLVQGLQDIFGRQKVVVLGLSAGSDANRAVRADRLVTIGLNEIEVEDIALLQQELRLNPTAVETANLLVDAYEDRWLLRLLTMDTDGLKEFAERSGAHPGALGALKRKLVEIRRRDYVRDEVSDSSLDLLIEDLQRQRHVVLEFGQFGRPLDYMLVANVITRRIHRRWSALSERNIQSQGQEPSPPQLMITIEEAHKFLSPQIASQTIFGTIAREMRKFKVTLLVVDQRPSGIDDEVLSQIGTRITCQLNDDRDIDAVFSGVGGASQLKSILATLDSQQQAMILGHAIRMPVVIRTRQYDGNFYRTMSPLASDPLVMAEQRPNGARTYDAVFGTDGDDN